MSESFAELFQHSIEEEHFTRERVTTGTVVDIDDKYVTIYVGLKSEGIVPLEEFMSMDGKLDVKKDDEVEVVVEHLADPFGETRLSHEKAKRARTWKYLLDSYEGGKEVQGKVCGKIKGGFAVDIGGIRGFLPGSLIDVRPVLDSAELEGQIFEFKIIKFDQKRNNIVLSRKAVIEERNTEGRARLLETLEEGQILEGVVKNLADYGAFVDLGGIDGLLHITDIAWKRVKSPSEILKVGQSVKVVVLKFDRERARVSLGIKQLTQDPWIGIKNRYPASTKLSGTVTNLTDYGCFVEIEDGVEGLVHMSEMDWTNKNIHPAKVVKVGETVEVVILEIDEERRRISLGMKQCQVNPWDQFAQEHKEGERLVGKIRSITDFGIFIGLTGNIDGLIHSSDLSWTEPGESAMRNYKKGDEIEVVILGIDPDRERISLGIKQLTSDAFSDYVATHQKGTIVTGTAVKVENKLVTVVLGEGVYGLLKASEVSLDKIYDATEHIQEGDEIEAIISSVNHKDRVIQLSVKAKISQEHHALMEKAAEEVGTATLGDLLKEQVAAQQTKQEEETAD